MRKFFLPAVMAVLIGIMWFAGISPAFVNAAETSFVDNQTWIGLNIPWAGKLWATADVEGGNPKLIVTIQNAINLILGLLGTIALVILLWGGFQMVTAAGDEGKHKKGFTILKQAATGLIFIGVAALFVQLIFWFISITTKTSWA